MGGLRSISGFLMIGFGVLFAAWQLYSFVYGVAEMGGGGSFGAFAFPGGLIIFGIQRLRTRQGRGNTADYKVEAVCPGCNYSYKTSPNAAPQCPRCGP